MKLWTGLSAPCKVCSMLCNVVRSLRQAERVCAGCQRRRRRRWQTWWRGASASPSAARPLSSALTSSPASCLASRARPLAGPPPVRSADSSAPAAALSPSPPCAPRPSRAAAIPPSRPAATHQIRLEVLRPDQAAAASHALCMAESIVYIRFTPARIADLPLQLQRQILSGPGRALAANTDSLFLSAHRSS